MKYWQKKNGGFDIIWDLKFPKPVQQRLFYDRKYHLKLFGLGGAVKPGEDKGDSLTKWMIMNALMMMVFVREPLPSPGSSEKLHLTFC